MSERPTGAVTFLFTDVEGSTEAWERDPAWMEAALEIHDRVLREAIDSHGGFVFATGGDSFSAAFSSPTDALTAAAEAQRGLTSSECGLRVRMGVHSGEAVERGGNYFGPALNRTARLMSIGHGGQVLVSTTTRELVTAVDFEFLDLGEHRLADLSVPTRVAQLAADGLERDFPSLRSVVAGDNLSRIGEVFGRNSDIEQVTELLGEHRLVTLTGAGGIGKTTLATSVATRMADPFPDGRWLVDLTDLPAGSERTAIVGAVAGVDDRFGSVEALAPRQMLLVLDNCEHLLDAARSYVADLIVTAPGVTVLATSREPLGIRRERVVTVQPLSVENGSDRASAVDLFIERVTEAGVTIDLDADRNTITAICQQVGGLPLAIELAAARTAIMNPGQILDRLEDRLSVLRGGRGGPEHHRTIEATIAWSYDLLDEDTQKLLRFLSVFEGGFDLEQAEAVGGDRAVDRLTDLVRKSLVTRVGDRFGMLEAVRQYGFARLEDSGEVEVARRRHFEFFADWASAIYSRDEFIQATVDELHWMTANLTNLQAAVRWGADHRSAVQAVEIAEILWIHQVTVLYGRPQPNWFEPLLAHLDDLPPQHQVGVLHGAAVIEDWILDNPDQAQHLLEAEYEIHSRTGLLPRSGVTPQIALGMVAIKHGRWEEAIRWFGAGTDLGPHGSVAAANLAITLFQTHQATTKEVLDLIQTTRRRQSRTADTQTEANLDILEAFIRITTGETELPRRLILRSLPSLRKTEIRYDLQYTALSLLSVIERNEGHLDACAMLLLEAIDLVVLHGLDPIWREPTEAIELADALIELGHPNTASRVVASFIETHTLALTPWDAQELDRLNRRIERATPNPPATNSDEERLPLIHDIRQALESATR